MTSAGKIQYLAKAVSPKEIRYDASLKPLRPAYCTSIGLVILAHMPERERARRLKAELLVQVTPQTITDPEKIAALLKHAQKNGFVEVKDANVEGASGVAAPIFGPSGEVIAALNLGAPTWRYERARESLIRIVCREAAFITESLGAAVRGESTA